MATKRKAKKSRRAKAAQLVPVTGETVDQPAGLHEDSGWEDYDGVEREVLMADPPIVRSLPFKSFEVVVLAAVLAGNDEGTMSEDFSTKVESKFPVAVKLLASANKYLCREGSKLARERLAEFEKRHDFVAPKDPRYLDFEYLTEPVIKPTSTSPARSRSGFISPKGLEKAVRRIWRNSPETIATILNSRRMTNDQYRELMKKQNRRFRVSTTP